TMWGPANLTPTTIGALLERSASTPAILCVLYAVTLIFAIHRFLLIWLPARTWDPPRLFVAAVAFALCVRSLSFATFAILSLQNAAPAPGTGVDESLFQRVLAVLFNVGDWALISTYLLLVVVWLELLQAARRHYFSRSAMRRDWLIAYGVVTGVCTLTQIGL